MSRALGTAKSAQNSAQQDAELESMERQSEKPEPRNSRKKPHSLRQTGEWKTNRVGATPDVTSRTTWPSSEKPAEMAGLCPYPFPYQIWFDGDAVRARTAKGLYRRGH